MKDLHKFLSQNKKSSCYIDGISDRWKIIIYLKRLNELQNVFTKSSHRGILSENIGTCRMNLFQRNLILYTNKKKLINEITNL